MLLESDISSEAVTSVLDALRKSLVGARLRRGADLAKVLEAALKRALRNLLSAGYWDFDASVQSFLDQGDAPVVVMLVGVNGTGKTTTAAKIANRLQSNGHSVIAAAGDTFRAGAIQQLESHCENLGIRCISSQRGGDAAAIARDAIESAKAKNINVVLVDTAGRMQNKTNLMKELEKVRRVANPHLVLFVGDALAGNDAVDQAKMFQEMMRFDGAVLSKMDTDARVAQVFQLLLQQVGRLFLQGLDRGTTIFSNSTQIGCWMKCFHEVSLCLKTKKLRHSSLWFICSNVQQWPILVSLNTLLEAYSSISLKPETSSIFCVCCKTKHKAILTRLLKRC